MSSFLHILFVIVANVIGWGMLVAGVIGFIGCIWFLITDKSSSGHDPYDPWDSSGMPWG